ncbi:MAG: class I SAM-dependent methyltransferase [Rubrobacter sp.]|nr:class I SAM-dependent methyltransferase [Rubrobacter sp.]
MHFTKFFSVVERDLEILNPTSHDKLMLLADYCDIRDGARVLDVGSGKGYMLRQWAKRWRIEGIGLEINSSFVAQSRSRASAEGVGETVTFVEGDAKDFVADPKGYDAVACIGAPFAIGSFEEAVGWMMGALKPSGVLAVGDVFLRAPLSDEVAERESVGPEDYRTLEESAVILEGHGLALDGLIASSEEDRDRYASGSWRAAHAWAAANPDDPDRAEILSLTDRYRKQHLRFTRRHLGWAMFVARRAVEQSGG